MRKGSRLVARISSSGQALSSASASAAHPSTRCSQLSRTKSVFLVSRCSTSTSVSERSGTSRTPSAEARAPGTSLGSESEASSTHHTPSSKLSIRSWATARANRVLPHPPGPPSVTRRASPPSNRSTRATSLSRPTKLLSCQRQVVGGALLWGGAPGGRLPGSRSTLRSFVLRRSPSEAASRGE
jgi:hypothetical protein